MRVIVPDTGGGFGQKMSVMPEDLAVPALARATGRPVKWVETRRENLMAASQAREGRIELEAAADASGVLLGLRVRMLSDAGAYHVYPLTQALEPLGTCGILPGPYRTPAYAYECLAIATNKPPLAAYRGVGMPFGVFAMERTLDLLADRLSLDPAEIRRRNLIPRDAYPFTSAAGYVYDSGDLPKALEQALDLAGYEGRRRERDEARRRGRLLGVGISCYTEYTGMGSETYRRRGMADVPGHEAARVTMHADGSVSCFVSFPSQGQGHQTTIAQLVADQLAVPLDRIAVLGSDTDAYAARDRHVRQPRRDRPARHRRAGGRHRAWEDPGVGGGPARGSRGRPRAPRRARHGARRAGARDRDRGDRAGRSRAGADAGASPTPRRRASRPSSPSIRRPPPTPGRSTWRRSKWTRTPGT